MFKKKVQPAGNGTKTGGGRSLLLYLLPAFAVGVLAMALLAFLAQQSVRSAADESARRAAASVAEAVAARIEGLVTARTDLLLLALADGRARDALEAGGAAAIDAVEAAMPRDIGGLVQARLLKADSTQPDPSGPAPLGYAGLDLVRRVSETRRPAAAEIHQIKSGTPYLALALPVGGGGVLFSAWDIAPLVRLIEGSPAIAGQLQLVQGGTDGYVVASGPGDLQGGFDDGRVAVAQSIWEIRYGVAPEVSGLGDPLLLAGLVGGGSLALLLTLILQWRSIARDLRADMGTLVNLGDSIKRRDGGFGPVAPHLSASADAIALLAQYAREARGNGGAPSPAAPSQVPRAAPSPAAPHMNSSPLAQGMQVEELDSDPSELLGGGTRTPADIEIPKTLFRAYDVRGIVGHELTPAFAELLGRGVASVVQGEGGQRVAVARDARLSSPDLASALVRGLNAGGCDVLDIGQAPTPLLYFTMQQQAVQGGVMVTGSHNPADYNGFKIVIGNRVLDGADLQALRQRMLDGAFSHGNGTVERIDMVGDYVDAVMQEVQLARPLKVVVDAGNGVAGDLAIATFEALGCEVVPLFCEPDGTFPNHHPDPSQPENTASLMLEVQAQEADLGIAFDGDGDRLGLVDETGANIWPDSVLMLLAADVLGRHPGVDVIYDVKSSRHLASFVLGHGGRPIMWKSGHSRMRAKMLETGALLGGEFSGHLFIKERWFGFDDAIYAATRVMELVALESRGASEMFADLPYSPATPEYHLMLEEGQSADLMRALDAHKVFDDARLVELDGLRVEFGNGWGLIRPSNTTPSLTFRFEADDEGALEQIKGRFRDLLRRVAPDMQAPF